MLRLRSGSSEGLSVNAISKASGGRMPVPALARSVVRAVPRASCQSHARRRGARIHRRHRVVGECGTRREGDRVALERVAANRDRRAGRRSRDARAQLLADLAKRAERAPLDRHSAGTLAGEVGAARALAESLDAEREPVDGVATISVCARAVVRRVSKNESPKLLWKRLSRSA